MRSSLFYKRLPLAATSPLLTLLLGALVTLAAFATDMGLPVLGATAGSLGVTPGAAALTLSVFMAGFAIGPLLFGPLSDRFGRRRLLLVGCAIFAVCGAIAAFATSLPALLLWRFVMGTGAGACQVVVVALVRDLYVGNEARARQSYVNLAAGVAPIIAPSVGVWVAAATGWRGIYATLAVGGALLLVLAWRHLPDPAPPRSEIPTGLAAALGSYARVLREPETMGYAVVMALSFGCLFAYVASSSLVLIEWFGVSQAAYGYLFASTASGLMAGAFLSARLSRRGIPSGRQVSVSLGVMTASTLLLLLLAGIGRLEVGSLIPLLIVGNIGQGVLRPHAAQGALEALRDGAGAGSAVLTASSMLVGALASAVTVSQFAAHAVLATTATMAVCAVGATAAYLLLVRPVERRRSLRPSAVATVTPSAVRELAA